MSGGLSGGLSTWPTATWWRPAIRSVAVVGPFLTCLVLAQFRDDVAAAPAVLALVLWVVASSAGGDRIAGVIAAVSGGAWFDFFLTEPYQRFTIADSEDVESAVLLVLISLAVTEVALWGYRQQATAARRSGYLDGVLGVARTVAEGDTPAAAVIGVVGRQVTDVLGADDFEFVEGPVRDTRIAVLDHDGVLTRGGHGVDVDRVGLPTDEYVAVPVRHGSRVIGHFLVTTTSHRAYPTREQRRVAVLLADQVAVALTDQAP